MRGIGRHRARRHGARRARAQSDRRPQQAARRGVRAARDRRGRRGRGRGQTRVRARRVSPDGGELARARGRRPAAFRAAAPQEVRHLRPARRELDGALSFVAARRPRQDVALDERREGVSRENRRRDARREHGAPAARQAAGRHPRRGPIPDGQVGRSRQREPAQVRAHRRQEAPPAAHVRQGGLQGPGTEARAHRPRRPRRSPRRQVALPRRRRVLRVRTVGCAALEFVVGLSVGGRTPPVLPPWKSPSRILQRALL
mmetsp:Transcript_7996/g.33002  ORF Transcript_7996/g.33002 Transcript_7996/m.33002 type:complete len:258 (-) Transcript_7996:665-1438(-)